MGAVGRRAYVTQPADDGRNGGTPRHPRDPCSGATPSGEFAAGRRGRGAGARYAGSGAGSDCRRSGVARGPVGSETGLLETRLVAPWMSRWHRPTDELSRSTTTTQATAEGFS